jgi:hypothetical protein
VRFVCVVSIGQISAQMTVIGSYKLLWLYTELKYTRFSMENKTVAYFVTRRMNVVFGNKKAKFVPVHFAMKSYGGVDV